MVGLSSINPFISSERKRFPRRPFSGKRLVVSVVGEKSPLHTSYERGCQGENTLPSPPGIGGCGDLHPVPPHSWRGDWFGRFASPRFSAAIAFPVACLHSTVS